MPGYETMLRGSTGEGSEKLPMDKPFAASRTWEGVAMVVAPVCSSNGTVRGVCGLELNDLLFSLSYPRKIASTAL